MDGHASVVEQRNIDNQMTHEATATAGDSDMTR